MLDKIDIFDSHTHIGPDFYSKVKGGMHQTFYANDLIKMMKKGGVKKSIVIPGATTQSIVCPKYRTCDNNNKPPVLVRREYKSYTLQCPVCNTRWKVKNNPYARKNDSLIKAARQHKNELFPFPIIDPRYPLCDRYLEKLINNNENVYGIKIHLAATFYDPKDLINSNLMNTIEDNNLPILFDPFQFKFSSNILELASHHPKSKIIIAHCVGLDEQILDRIGRLNNVYVDTSAITQFYDKRRSRGNFRIFDSAKTVYNLLLSSIGNDKLIFGTDFPIMDYFQEIRTFKNLDFEPSFFEKVGNDNIESLLGISE